MPVQVLMAAYAVGSSLYNSYKKNKAGEAQDDLNFANYARATEQFEMDTAYVADLNAYSAKQLAFSYELEAWGQANYGRALQNAAAEAAYKEKALADKKFGAQVDFMAQKHVSDILQVGATDQASTVIQDVLRVAQANKRGINVGAEKMMGTIVAESMSGIAQGASKDRMIVEAFQMRNKAAGAEASKAKGNIIQVVNQRNKVINDTNLQTAAAWRGLTAIMKLEVAPTAQVMAPRPVSHDMAPIRGAGAAPIEGGNYVPYSGTAPIADYAGAAASGYAAYNKYNT